MTAGGEVGAVELGGTHVTAARVDTGPVDPARPPAAPARPVVVVGSVHRRGWEPDASREELLAALEAVSRAAAAPSVGRWGVATPGPFDYARGICRIRGVAKLDALDGVDLRSVLADALDLADPGAVRFLNDADAFLLGEWRAGAAHGHERAMGITLGSGLGSGFAVGGRIVTAGPGVPPEGRLDLLPFRGAPVEDTISRRGFLAAWAAAGGDPALDVVDVAARAREGDPLAGAAFDRFAADLAAFLAPCLHDFAPTCLVVGGSIAGAWDLLEPAVGGLVDEVGPLTTAVPTALHADAPLIGAAAHATTDA